VLALLAMRGLRKINRFKIFLKIKVEYLITQLLTDISQMRLRAMNA